MVKLAKERSSGSGKISEKSVSRLSVLRSCWCDERNGDEEVDGESGET